MTKFSDDPEMQAQYFFECRILGINPYEEYDEPDYDEEEGE